jgi:nucleotide-binding universal stress UspA family protein
MLSVAQGRVRNDRGLTPCHSPPRREKREFPDCREFDDSGNRIEYNPGRVRLSTARHPMSAVPKSKIVVPVDFSGESGLAIDAALELAEDVSRIHLVHVLFPLDNASPGVVWGGVSDDQREQAIREEFDELIKERNVVGVHSEIRFGNPGLEVAEYAEEIGADLIVMPSHGYHGMKRLILGSVAERVIRHAKCSVLVLRRTDAD